MIKYVNDVNDSGWNPDELKTLLTGSVSIRKSCGIDISAAYGHLATELK
jgi:hypothetical protein